MRTLAILAALLLAMITVAAAIWADRHAKSQSDATARQMARLQLGLLTSELQKFRLLPMVLREYHEVSASLVAGSGDRVARQLDRKLELLAARTGAAAIYVLDTSGRTVAASNWRLPISFVGKTYAFRPYYRGALTRGLAEMFALGTVSQHPGLYIARRIDADGRPIGVIVVKVEFDRLEELWLHQPGMTMVSDDHGVTIITSVPSLRFRATRPLSPATRALVRRTLQFGGLPLRPIGFDRRGETAIGPDGTRWRVADLPSTIADGTLHYYQPLAPARSSADASARTVVLASGTALGLLLLLIGRARERTRTELATRRRLEDEVVERTRALSEANDLLHRQAMERDEADRRFRDAREELAQANRLATLGQVTAGIVHEINQPTAAIRTFAENAAVYLDRGAPDQALANIRQIVGLTQRIGTITADLRGFAARRSASSGIADLAQALDGALLLIGDRLRHAGARVTTNGFEGDPITVKADRVRLEQVFVNLLQNACDAFVRAGTADPRIAIAVSRRPRDVLLCVSDNGPGIAPALVASLFEPFVTDRRDGLGLGLAIARDIAREFGGEIDLAPAADAPSTGAAFLVTMRLA